MEDNKEIHHWVITIDEEYLEEMFDIMFPNPGVHYKVNGPQLLLRIKKYLGFIKEEE